MRIQGDLAVRLAVRLRGWSEGLRLARLYRLSWASGLAAVKAVARFRDAARRRRILARPPRSASSLNALMRRLESVLVEDVLGFASPNPEEGAGKRASSTDQDADPGEAGMRDLRVHPAIADIAPLPPASATPQDRDYNYYKMYYEIRKVLEKELTEILSGRRPPSWENEDDVDAGYPNSPNTVFASTPCAAVEAWILGWEAPGACEGVIGEPRVEAASLAMAATPLSAATYYHAVAGLAAAVAAGFADPLDAPLAHVFALAYTSMTFNGSLVVPEDSESLVLSILSASNALFECALKGERCEGEAGRVLEEELGRLPEAEPKAISARVGRHVVEMEGVPLSEPPMSRGVQVALEAAHLYRLLELLKEYDSKPELALEKLRHAGPPRKRIEAARPLSYLLAVGASRLFAVVPGGSVIRARHPEHGEAEIRVPWPAIVEVYSLSSVLHTEGVTASRSIRDVLDALENIGLEYRYIGAVIADVDAAGCRDSPGSRCGVVSR